MRNIQGIVFITLCLLLPSMSAQAEIYQYIDEDGVLHFTNMPSLSGYRINSGGKHKKGVRPRNRYDHLISEASKKHSISFGIIKAIIKAESNFNPYAVSRAGAVGLMQIMPQNFRQLNITNPYDPRQNIMGGSQYFKYLMKRYNGNMKLALAGYNAGPKRVDDHKGIPPIMETRNYVKRVLIYYRKLMKAGKG